MNFLRFGSHDDRELENEIMASDRLRAGIVGTAFLGAALGVALLSTQFWRLAGGPLDFLLRTPYWIGITVLAFLGAYEWAYRFITGQLMKRGLRTPLPARFLNAFLEVSLPTVILALLSTSIDPEVALNLPPIFLYFLFLALSTLRIDPRLALFAGVMAGLEYTGLAWFLLQGREGTAATFWAVSLSKGLLLAASGALLAFVTWQIRKRIIGLLRSREQQAKIASIFGQHVSPAVMQKLLTQQAGQESEVRHVTVLFLDIRNFTTFSESRNPDEVVDYLNRLFGFMVDAVNRHHGIINKFLGDGFMAVFGAPLDDGQSEDNAVAAALAISDGLKERLAQGLEPTRIGIGLHSGPAVTGNVGSHLRREYTIIGDVVNLASRIESKTKDLAAEILVSKEVFSAASAVRRSLSGEPLGPVMVKGREAPVELYRLRSSTG